MQKLIAVLSLSALPLCAQMQDEAIFGRDDQWNLYTQPQIEWTDIGGTDATLGGVTFGTIRFDAWRFGLRLSALTSDLRVEGEWMPVDLDAFGTWETGADIGYIFNAPELVHFDAGLAVLYGTLDGDGSDHYLSYVPSVAACLNLHSTWEIGLQAGWRMADGVGLYGLDDDDFSGFTCALFARATEF